MTKLKWILAAVVIGLGSFACAHKEESQAPVVQMDVEKGNYAYGGRCAASMTKNQFDVQGDPKYTLEHKGKTYCFSSADARDSFKRDTVKNIETADRHWKLRAERVR